MLGGAEDFELLCAEAAPLRRLCGASEAPQRRLDVERFQRYEGVASRGPAYSDVGRLTLTYSDVFKRIQTYADLR